MIAPFAESSEPILLGSETPGGEGVTATPSHPAQRIQLGENEVLITKVDYLQGSMGGFEKKTKWLMDWRYPFSSMAAGSSNKSRVVNAIPSQESGRASSARSGRCSEFDAEHTCIACWKAV